MGLPLLLKTGAPLPRWLPLAEPAAVFTLVLLYIWRLRFTAPASWLPILGLVLLSHYVHGEEPADLGFRRAGFAACVREIAPAVLLMALALWSAGALFQTVRPMPFENGVAAYAAYCLWGLFQQYLLNAYFVNRLAAVLPPRRVPLLAAALFAAVHLPNGFLMAVTFPAGYLCARVYLRHRNLYALGLAHAALGFLLYLVVPDAVSHHLRVGPSWFRGGP